MDVESLIQYGFKEFKVAPHERQDRNWQYCKRDEHGKKFYVQVRFWQHSKYSKSVGEIADGWDAWCQYDMRKEQTFDVTLMVSNMTPAEVVEWFDNVFDKLGCTHYELNS